VRFNYGTESWESKRYELPTIAGDYALLTPSDMLTKDEMWISKPGLLASYDDIAASVPNEQLRSQINNYFASQLSRKPKKRDYDVAAYQTLRHFPVLLEYYILRQEDNGDKAVAISREKVSESIQLFFAQASELVRRLQADTRFYEEPGTTYDQARRRVIFLRDVIENKDGYKLFYVNGNPIKRELDLQIMFRLTWFGASSDVNREVNNGRGPADFTISKGAADKSLVEFKLASNSHLKRNLEKQVAIYQRASDSQRNLKVIMYFSGEEELKVGLILSELGLASDESVILIDARRDNKPSASRA
jgi:hypothetical protein